MARRSSRRDEVTGALQQSVRRFGDEVHGCEAAVAELAGLDVRAIVVAGGVSHASLELPPPRGVVTIDISGGANDLTLTRPRGTALRLRVRGGASNVILDGRRLASMGRDAYWASTDGDEPDQYEVGITGGARTLAVAIA